MNILISTMGTEYVENWMIGLLDRLVVDECVAIFVDEKRMREGALGRIYATRKFLYKDCIRAKYDDINELNIPPVSEDILRKMEPFESVIMWMLARTSGREYLHRWNDYCKHIRVWNYILDFSNIDVFLGCYIPHEGFDFIIYALCKIKGIKVVFSMLSHFANYSYLIEDVFNQIPALQKEIDFQKEKYKNTPIESIKLDEDMEKYFHFYFGGNDLTPYYMNSSRILPKKVFNQYVLHIKRILFFILQRVKFSVSEIMWLFSFSADSYRRIEGIANKATIFRENIILCNYYDKHSCPADYSKKYIYVPLHVQPELTTSPCGKRFVDQILMIQILSYCLPKGYLLYVKEHPAQYQIYGERYPFRTLEFYDDLLEIPNVRLIAMGEDTYKLIRKASAIASVTGTAGFEAIIYNKLFFMFGFYLTQYAPNVVPIRTVDDCFFAMEKMMKFNQSNEESKKQIKIYFKSLEKFLYKGVPVDSIEIRKVLPEGYWSESKENIINAYCQKLVDLMGNKILKS